MAVKESKSERRHVTVLFSDLSGYTAMTERLDPEEVRKILDSVFQKISEIIEKHDGFIERYIGDSVMAVFGMPRTHEDDPVRAVQAAFEIHNAVKAMGSKLQEKIGRPIFMHTGINSGLVVTGQINADTGSHGLTGLTINLASRLESLSKDDEILVGHDTFRMTEPFFNFQELKPVHVKGRTEALKIYKAESKKKLNTRKPQGGSFFSGREQEISVLTAVFSQVFNSGIGHIVIISGDPGIGKSRLVQEFKTRPSPFGLLWLKGRASSSHNEKSYGPFAEIVKAFAEINDTGDGQETSRLEEKLTEILSNEAADVLPYLSMVLSIKGRQDWTEKSIHLDSESFKSNIFRAFYLLFKRLNNKAHLVIELEDFHWADQSTVDLLEHLMKLVMDTPLIILIVTRDQKGTPASSLINRLDTLCLEHCSKIRLTPLSEQKILELVGQKLDSGSISSQLSALILRKCEGNPLFLEELCRTLEQGNLIIKDDITGQITIKPHTGKIPIPDTLRGIIESSIDRLDSDMKDVLKAASVIGRNFLYCLLKEIEDSKKNLDSELAALIRENFIKQKEQNHDPEYSFYHDLIRDAAYETILISHREKLHQKVGEAIESIFSGQLEKFYGLLSYHFAKGSQWDKARQYLIKAGDQASRIAGDSEALACYKKALAANEALFSDQINDLKKAVYQRKLAEIYFRRGEYDKALSHLKLAMGLLKISYPFGRWEIRFATLAQFLRQMAHRLFSHILKPAIKTELTLEEQETFHIFEIMTWIDFYINQERLAFGLVTALNYAEKIGYAPRTAQAFSGMALLFDSIGFPAMAKKYHDLSIQKMHSAHDFPEQATVHLCRGYHFFNQGLWDQALASFELSVERFKKIGYFKKWANAKLMISFVFFFQGRFAQSLEIGAELARIGLESGDNQIKGHGLITLGRNQIVTGDADQALPNLRNAIQLLEPIPDYYALADVRTDLARYYMNLEDYETADSILTDNESMIRKKGLHGWVVSIFYNCFAENRMKLFENQAKPSRSQNPVRLKRNVNNAVRFAKPFKLGMPRAMRLQGLFFHLKKAPDTSKKIWNNGIALCQKMGCRYEEGLIHRDMGKYFHDLNHLQKARDIFSETGAWSDLRQIDKIIETLPSLTAVRLNQEW